MAIFNDKCNPCGYPPAPKPAKCEPPYPPMPAPIPCAPIPKPIPAMPPAPSVCEGMDLYEAMNGLTDRVNICIKTYNDVMANSYQALRNLEQAAEENGSYYGEDEVGTEQGYYPDEGNIYYVTHKKCVDKHSCPIRMELKLAYDNTTNANLEQPITDASLLECANIISAIQPEKQNENGWCGNVIYKGAPLPVTSNPDGWTMGFTRNGTLRVYANAISNEQLLRDGIENAMGCVGRIIVAGEIKDEVASAIAPIVAIGQNSVNKEVFILSAGSTPEQSKAGLNDRGLSSRAAAEILKGYGCDTAVVISSGDKAMTLDKGSNLFVPETIPEQTKAKAFWFITRKQFFKNDYDRELAELIQNYGQLKYTALLNELGILNLKNYTEKELAAIKERLAKFAQKLAEFQSQLEELQIKYTTLENRVSEIEEELTTIKNTINTLQQTVENLIDIVNGMQNTIAKIQQTLSEMQSGAVKLPYIEKADGIGTGTTKLENITVSGDAVISDLDVKAECWVNTPTQPLQAANKKYVDDAVGNALGDGEYLPLRGGTMTGNILMDTHDITGLSQLGFKSGSSNAYFSFASAMLVLNGASLRGNTYVVPTQNSDYAQKKYVDDKIAQAVIEATSGGLTETAADSIYWRLDNGNQPSATDVEWSGVKSFITKYHSLTGTDSMARVMLKAGSNYGMFMFQNDEMKLLNSSMRGLPLYGAYSSENNKVGYFVTDTYLNSKINDLPFLKTSGGTMRGDINFLNDFLVETFSEVLSGINRAGYIYMNNDCGFENAIRKWSGESDNSIHLHKKGDDEARICISNLGDPVAENDAVPLSYLKKNFTPETNKVEQTGAINIILGDNTEYSFTEVTALDLVCDSGKTAVNHGFIKFAADFSGEPTLTSFAGIAGDDIAEAASNETWEFSTFAGYIIVKNWGNENAVVLSL